jgi:enoyl-CoA hydratase/carnithine racemase
MTFRYLKVDVENQITTIALNRPGADNALDVALMQELHAYIDELRRDETIRAVIITGAGRTFSAGADVEMLEAIGVSYTPEQTREEIGRWRDTFDALTALPQVTIAAINGLTLGGGVVLALACDFRLASSRAIFGLPEIKLGMILALGGTQRLTRMIGTAAAKEMILRGRNLTAMEALRAGLVNRVCDHGDLLGLAHSWAERAVKYSPRAIKLAKDLIDGSFERSAAQSAQAETDAQVELLHSVDFLTRLKTQQENGEI